MTGEPFRLRVDPDVRRAETPPARFYRDPDVHARVVERVLARGWQWVGDARRVPGPHGAAPATLWPGSLDEPLVLTRDGGTVRALSNACTHRGALVCERPTEARGLRCPYHGRRFGLDGRFASAPGFEGAVDFPRTGDDLRAVPLGRAGDWLFAALDPDAPFDAWWAPVRERCGHLPFDRAELDPSRAREWIVDAHWALYVENYLEGLHIPFVHPELSRALDMAAYTHTLLPHGTLQLGLATDADDAFDPLPAGHPEHGERVAAWYFWLFPGFLLNVYPWGCSLNLVHPQGPARTRVTFLSYVWDAARLATGAGSALDLVERQDERAVESVQRGLQGRLYRAGRYAPEQEAGTHHFHRLLAERLADA